MKPIEISEEAMDRYKEEQDRELEEQILSDSGEWDSDMFNCALCGQDCEKHRNAVFFIKHNKYVCSQCAKDIAVSLLVD